LSNVFADSHSFSWHSWDRKNSKSLVDNRPIEKSNSNALQNILTSSTDVDFQGKYPKPSESTILWTTFFRNVHPLVKIGFDWDFNRLRSSADQREKLSSSEHALLFAIFLVSVGSVSDEECQQSFNRTKSDKLSEYQMLTEHALAQSDLLSTSSIILLQASTLYIVCHLIWISLDCMLLC
jgi:hypothetical protein